MNMKRIAFALLAALLLCLIVGSALAELAVVDLNGKTGEIKIEENAIVTGSATGVYLVVAKNVTELTLRGVSITSSNASALEFNGDADDTLTLILEGDNTLESSKLYGIEAYKFNTTLIITGSGTLEAIGAEINGEGGRGIHVNGSLKITSTGSVTAKGGTGTKIEGQNSGWGGTGIRAMKLEISGTGSVTATGGNGDTFGGMGMDIQFDDGLSIANGSAVTVTAGEGLRGFPALQTYGNIFVDSATLTVNAPQSYGIFLDSDIGSAEKLTVSGESHITVNSGRGAAICFTNEQKEIPAQIELNGAFVMRAGDNKDSAAEIHAYDQKYPYLSIEPATPIEPIAPPTPDNANLPQTGDNSNVILWSALTCISVISMMTLVRKRKEA